MSDQKSKSKLFAGKLLEIAENSINLYYKDEQKKLAQRRWTIAKTKLKSFSSLRYKNLRIIKTTNDIKTTVKKNQQTAKQTIDKNQSDK